MIFIRWFTLTLKLFICILSFISLVSCSASPERVATSVAKQIVKEKLLAPATANFQRTEVIYTKTFNDGMKSYVIQVEVDAQNSFGATIRSVWLVWGYIKPNEPQKMYYNNLTCAFEVSNPPQKFERDVMIYQAEHADGSQDNKKQNDNSIKDERTQLNNNKKISIVKSTASSCLPETKTWKYLPYLAYDGNSETAWQEGVEGHGVGEWIQFEFRSLWKVEKIRLLNGYCKYSKTGVDRHPQNSRIKTAVLHFSDNSTQEIQLSDTREYQEITINPVSTSSIKLEIKDYYPGSKWSDNSLSEIEFYGN